MRAGQNPAKAIEHVRKPEQVTVSIITYLPFLSGYYAQGLEVLKVCLRSIIANTEEPFDLLVFDNASCAEVVNYLNSLKEKGRIQYLILSEENIGKVGAWNFIFGAAPGEYVAYADSDVYFFPRWLSRHLEVFQAFPEAGTVCGLPRRGRRTFYRNTIERGSRMKDVFFEEGKFIPEEWVIDHARSLGKLETVREDLQLNDYRLTRKGISAYATATHFQFMVRTETIRHYLPFPHDRPMGDAVANLDRAIDGNNLLRLAVTERAVLHLGNTLDKETIATLPSGITEGVTLPGNKRLRSSLAKSFFAARPIKKLLLSLYHRIFRIYYG